jgi:anaerobic dimethyl sulfoxide reductase subunit C (anchor subunit)
MNTGEWALVAFTICAQMSVGAFVVLGVVHWFAAGRAGLEEADRLADRALLAIGPTLLLGMAASLLHLGDPFNGYRAVANLGSSWLSREIVSGSLFAAAAVGFTFVQWRKLATARVRMLLGATTAAVGLALVYSMGRVYLLRTVPVWNTVATPVMFFVTTFLLGSLAIGAAYVASYRYLERKDPDRQAVQSALLRGALRWIAIVAILLLGIEFVVVPMRVAYLASGGPAASQSATMFVGPFQLLVVVRLALVFAGAAVLGLFVYQNASSPGRERVMGTLTYAAFVLVLVGEVVGRFLFYATYARVGV